MDEETTAAAERATTEVGTMTGAGRLGAERTELTMNDTGQWLAISMSSAHFFDLDAPSVTRMPGVNAFEFVSDSGRALRTLEICRVGESGRWTMEPLPHERDLEFRWHISTPIVMIVQVLDLDRSASTTG
jgi:hypothetical protein